MAVSDAGTSANDAGLTLHWLAPAPNATVSGVATFELAGTKLLNVEVFRSGVRLVRCTVDGNGTHASCPVDTTTLADGALTVTAHGWNSAAGQPFTADADAGALSVVVMNGPKATWAPLTVMAVENPLTHGALGDDTQDDVAALRATVNALPAAGGLIYFPPGKTFRKNDTWVITKSHVKLWAPNGQATLHGVIQGATRKHATICRNSSGCGVFGLRFTSDAVARFDALEDNQFATDHATDVEVVGCDIKGSASAGVFIYNLSQRTYVEGNYVHLTYADTIHHTDGSRESWVWGNFMYNALPSKGDDGIACVTYCPTCPKCGDMEWWGNTHLGAPWGRGYAVIGGDHIDIHDNWAIRIGGAGLIVASEPSYSSASSNDITIRHNWVSQCGQTISHPNILISGQNPAADPLTNIALTDNVSVDGVHGAYGTEGEFSNVTNVNLSQNAADLPTVPTLADVAVKDTSILKTRDPSFVAAPERLGLYRIHVRVGADAGFEQRFEYVFKGAAADVTAFTSASVTAGNVLLEQRDVQGTTYAVVLSAQPLVLPTSLSGVAFTELRSKDRSGQLDWLWRRLDQGAY